MRVVLLAFLLSGCVVAPYPSPVVVAPPVYVGPPVVVAPPVFYGPAYGFGYRWHHWR